jgi:hypothetical protein
MAPASHLKRVTTVRLSVDHLHDLFMHRLSRLVSIAPIVASPHATLADVEILGIVNVSIWARLYSVNHLK